MKSRLLIASIVWGVVFAATPVTAADLEQSARSAVGVEDSTKSLADIWGLTLDEAQRYQQLMRGYRGSVSDPRISPIEVLGIHARDVQERKRYAEMLVRVMVEDQKRIQAFERERMSAVQRLYPNLPVIDFGKLPRGKGESTFPFSSGSGN